MDTFNKQLKKGILEILVLKIIYNEDVYGYELIKKLESESNGLFLIKEGSLYPIMYRLEDKGFIEHYRKEVEGKRTVPRKYYKVTVLGKEHLNIMTRSWDQFSDIVSKILKEE